MHESWFTLAGAGAFLTGAAAFIGTFINYRKTQADKEAAICERKAAHEDAAREVVTDVARDIVLSVMNGEFTALTARVESVEKDYIAQAGRFRRFDDSLNDIRAILGTLARSMKH